MFHRGEFALVEAGGDRESIGHLTGTLSARSGRPMLVEIDGRPDEACRIYFVRLEMKDAPAPPLRIELVGSGKAWEGHFETRQAGIDRLALESDGEVRETTWPQRSRAQPAPP